MKGITQLFTVPKGEKISDKHFKRVLVSSFCSILLCLTCLIGTTWAWYTATIETPAFSVSVAEHKLQLHDGENYTDLVEPLTLNAGDSRQVNVRFYTDATKDAFNNTAGRYIIITAKNDADNIVYSGYVPAELVGEEWVAQITLNTVSQCRVWLTTSWFIPGTLQQYDPNTPLVAAAKSADAIEATTVPTTEAAKVPTTEAAKVPTTEPKPAE